MKEHFQLQVALCFGWDLFSKLSLTWVYNPIYVGNTRCNLRSTERMLGAVAIVDDDSRRSIPVLTHDSG